MSKVHKIRSVEIDDAKTSLYTRGGKFHMIEHNKENNRIYRSNIFLTMILPVLVTLAVISIDYGFVKFLNNTPPSILGIFVALVFSVVIVVQLIPLPLVFIDGYIIEFFGKLFSLFTSRGRFSIYVEWRRNNTNTLSEHINKRFRKYYDNLDAKDNIVTFLSEVNEQTLISFIKNCQKSEELSNRIKDARKSFKDSSVDKFIHKDLRILIESLQEELDQVDAHCQTLIDNADSKKRALETNQSNAKALKILAA